MQVEPAGRDQSHMQLMLPEDLVNAKALLTLRPRAADNAAAALLSGTCQNNDNRNAPLGCTQSRRPETASTRMAPLPDGAGSATGGGARGSTCGSGRYAQRRQNAC